MIKKKIIPTKSKECTISLDSDKTQSSNDNKKYNSLSSNNKIVYITLDEALISANDKKSNNDIKKEHRASINNINNNDNLSELDKILNITNKQVEIEMTPTNTSDINELLNYNKEDNKKENDILDDILIDMNYKDNLFFSNYVETLKQESKKYDETIEKHALVTSKEEDYFSKIKPEFNNCAIENHIKVLDESLSFNDYQDCNNQKENDLIEQNDANTDLESENSKGKNCIVYIKDNNGVKEKIIIEYTD